MGRCSPLKRPSRPPKPRAHLRMPACHCLTRPFDELEKGSLLHRVDKTLSTIGRPDTHTRGTGKNDDENDTHLARDRRTTLQEADGMRSSEDDLAAWRRSWRQLGTSGRTTVSHQSSERRERQRTRTRAHWVSERVERKELGKPSRPRAVRAFYAFPKRVDMGERLIV